MARSSKEISGSGSDVGLAVGFAFVFVLVLVFIMRYVLWVVLSHGTGGVVCEGMSVVYRAPLGTQEALAVRTENGTP